MFITFLPVDHVPQGCCPLHHSFMQSPENLRMTMRMMKWYPHPSSSQQAKPVTAAGMWTVQWGAITSVPGGKLYLSASLEWASSSGARSEKRPRWTSLWRKICTNIYQDCCPTKNRSKSLSKTNHHSGLKDILHLWCLFIIEWCLQK